jgi:hypothetical protein
LSQGTTASSTNKTDHYDITEILLKVALNTQPINEWVIRQPINEWVIRQPINEWVIRQPIN